ncbi:[protein-PII] uridylyltransferase [Snodgrassella alvi]|uniref:Bifunctional uridylyltransferase/uridylyl-removing enzyme n=1 Tax=Snodgrassella alvi TaxID=1196083 RepID=A0A855FSP1_9NEIS|nr:[protein-PII] uridylyltransferase [Snodgrassella alvi]PIT30559.1 [protein-PII] uridylyltransferase [Snodgrassella alvi]PIT55197.1 [protein-PII] uridylyltransferase [Snodgrassella alvi]PIT58613.1 [protein-PII] uridylyltransferase [Snodgrassella alvi]
MAIGGFGRGEMYPYSDMDMAIVSKNAIDDELQQQIATFVQILWDIHLQPAPKVGTIEELCESARQDLTGDSALLESRFLCGQRQLATKFIHQLGLQRDVAAFIEGKILEQWQRYAKASGEASLLEANVKTTQGGLRDIHTLLWLAKVQGLSPHIHDLMKNAILNHTEAKLLLSCQKRLAKIRIELHLTAKRAEDRLIFDLQTQVAQNLGYRDDATSRASEKLMHDFYRALKGVKQLSGILVPMLRDRVYAALPRVVVELDQHYYQVGNMLAVHDLDLFQQKPEHIFTILRIAQEHSDIIGLAPKTLRVWWTAAHQLVNEEFYQNPVNRKCFASFFRHGDGLTHLLRFINLYGVLGRYLPAWGKIVGLLQHDLFHIYPVDDHILMVVRNMRRLAMEQHSHELPFASTLMHTFARQHILYMAALFHDIAKGRGGDHAQKGVSDARRFAEDHFLDKEESDLLAWLVQQHLLMSTTAQKEDIQDPEVVARFSKQVQTVERLTALYLLTVADIRGTNPKIWNSWKASLLESLYKAALHHLNGKQSNRQTAILDRRQQAIHELSQYHISEAQQRELWHILGQAYFARHEWQDILWHLSKIINYEQQAQAHSRLLPDTDTLKVMVYMPNRSKLFTELASVFSEAGMNILTARAYITDHNFILDTFILQFPSMLNTGDYLAIQNKTELALNQFVNGHLPMSATNPAKLSRRSRHMPIAPRISIDEEDNAGWYNLHIITANRRFLLANIAAVLSELNISIRFAKITTLDERVEDSFLVYAPQLADTQQQLRLKNALLDQLLL